MPRSRKTKEWRPDRFEQDMIDQIAKYTIVAEQRAAHLRSFPTAEYERLYSKLQAEFLGNPDKYPSVFAEDGDTEGRKQFRAKCEEICFSSKPSQRAEE